MRHFRSEAIELKELSKEYFDQKYQRQVLKIRQIPTRIKAELERKQQLLDFVIARPRGFFQGLLNRQALEESIEELTQLLAFATQENIAIAIQQIEERHQRILEVHYPGYEP